MIKVSEEILVKADSNKVWAFLTDFSRSLSFNRFHTELELPSNYSLGKMKNFKINHNFGFGNYNMIAEIKECIPPNRLILSEYCSEDPKKGFPHTIEFQIEPTDKNSKISYVVSGTFGGKVQDMSFKPILKGVAMEELLKIKNAIESSESVPKPLQSETVKSV